MTYFQPAAPGSASPIADIGSGPLGPRGRRQGGRSGLAHTLRWADEADYDALGRVMFEAVRSGESQYSEAQRAAWVPVPRSGPQWHERLSGQDVILAEEDGETLGFMSLTADAYVDFAYIRPRAQHSGLFRRMFERIEGRAASTGHKRLRVHASLMAEPAFTAVGFTIRHREEVELGGERFQRFEMEKMLSV